MVVNGKQQVVLFWVVKEHWNGVIREVKEELGVDLNKKDAILIDKTKWYFKNCPDILFVYLFKGNIDINNVIRQDEKIK